MGPYQPGTAGLIEAVQDLSLARTLGDVQAVVRDAARRLTGADGATFVLRDGERCHYVDEDAIEPLWKGQRFPLEACISGWAMLHRQAVSIPDIYVDDRIPHDAYRPTFVTSLVMVPIRTHKPIGAIGNYWATHHAATDDEVRLLQALADSASVAMENVAVRGQLEQRVRTRTAELEAVNAQLQEEILERRRVEEEVRRLSLTDELTGLWNRRGFRVLANQELNLLDRSGQRGAILYVDVDGLKKVNDEGGHEAGDRLLQAVGALLVECSRKGDIAARMGGDEFAVFVVPDVRDTAGAFVRRLIRVARERGIGLSVGVAEVDPHGGTTLDRLLAEADGAMYESRQQRAGGTVVVDAPPAASSMSLPVA